MSLYPLRETIKNGLKKGLDVLVIGGGINGAGVLRDCALRGLKAGLVEKNDFSSGTSSRSSKLIHGGLRYLEHMDFPLVFESCRERALLTRLLPDLVRLTEFLFPIYKRDRFNIHFMDLGLWLYDCLALFGNFSLHRKLSAGRALEMEPSLEKEGLTGALLYYDCRVNDASLVLQNIVSALNNGSCPLNYAEAVGFRKSGGTLGSVSVKDALSGEVFEVPCRSVVCACGPWSNRLYENIEGEKRPLLRLTKGIHLLVPAEKLRVDRAVVVNSNEDKRIIFIIPWDGFTLLGTTDTDYDGDVDAVFPDREDVASLLNVINRIFPGSRLSASDAISAFAGLRPLVLADGSTSRVSRQDKIFQGPSGAFYIGGGKLTTYRNMARKAVDKVIRSRLKDKKKDLNPCWTHALPLHDPFTAAPGPLPAPSMAHLAARYGKSAGKIQDLIRSDPSLAEPVCPGLPFLYAEIPYGARFELLATLTDFFRLRTDIFLKAHDNGLNALSRCASLLARSLNLDDPGMRQQIRDYERFVQAHKACLSKG